MHPNIFQQVFEDAKDHLQNTETGGKHGSGISNSKINKSKFQTPTKENGTNKWEYSDDWPTTLEERKFAETPKTKQKTEFSTPVCYAKSSFRTPQNRKPFNSKLPVKVNSPFSLYKNRSNCFTYRSSIEREDADAFLKEMETKCKNANELLEKAQNALKIAKEKNKKLIARNRELRVLLNLSTQN